MEICIFPGLPTNQGRQGLLQLRWKGPESMGFRDGLRFCRHETYTRSQQPALKSQQASETMYYVAVPCFLHGGPGRPLYEAVKVEHKFRWSLRFTEDTMTVGSLPRKAADARWSSAKKEITGIDSVYLEGRAAQGCSTTNVNKNPECYNIKLKNIAFSLLSFGLALVWSFLAISIPWF